MMAEGTLPASSPAPSHYRPPTLTHACIHTRRCGRMRLRRTGQWGGGIYSRGSVKITDTTFTGCSAEAYGNAMYLWDVDASLDSNSVTIDGDEGQSAHDIYLEGTSTLTCSSSCAANGMVSPPTSSCAAASINTGTECMICGPCGALCEKFPPPPPTHDHHDESRQPRAPTQR